ncbi:MAG: hypothetical protein Q8P20_09920 [bacterium]|nr:hypothetical protein [bacterium]
MKIVFNNSIVKITEFVKEHTRSGVISQLSWDSLELPQAMNLLFKTRPNEVITFIEVSERGLTAYFERKKE